MEHASLQIDDLREMRQAYYEYEQYRRDELQYRREEWPEWRDHPVQRGVVEVDMGED